ncbi:MAG: bacterio-opsin activator domain-containing protein [Halohasta sp.]
MPQVQVRYVAPDTRTASAVISALETAGPELSVSHLASASAALAAIETDAVDCLVVDRLPDGGTASVVEAARSASPSVPVVWFTDEPADRVVDGFDRHTEYVHKAESAQQAGLVVHRIRSVLERGAPSAETSSAEIVDRSNAGILVFDSEGLITRLNPAAERLLGLPATDAIGGTCESLDMRTVSNEAVPPSDRPVARVLASGDPVVDELVSVPADGDRRWLSISASPLADGETADGVVVTLEDVSAEVELETTLETVLDRMTDGFLAFDTDLRFTYFSKRAIDTDRYPSEDVIGHRLSDLHPFLAQYDADLRDVLDTQEPKTVETYLPEPTDAWYRARLYPSDSGVSVFFREITAEKRRERELEQYKTIIESVQDGVCLLDSTMDFVFVNRAFTELVDYSEAELLGVNAALVTDGVDMETARERRTKLFDGDDEAAILLGELTTGSGDRVPVETWMTPIELADGEQGTVGVVRDLSYRKRTEATFTALYDAAHALLSARSTEEIAAIGVEAAGSVLGFEDAIVLSYDDERNVFRPLAYTPSAEARLPAPLPISASESSIAGRAFFESEPIATEDMSDLPEAYNPETPYRRAMFVPIDEHGVLFVGDTEIGATSDQTLTVAELLGATLAAAFTRLASERRSEAHQRTLAERTAELETLAHTNALVEALGDRLFDASTREEIESTVCSALTGFDRYRFAWIGAAECRTDTVALRASSGIDEGYLDWLVDRIGEAGCGSVDEPTCRVLTTSRPVSVDRIARDWQAAPWRKEALSRGCQSVLSVPLTHNEISYGALSVYADTSGAFDEYTETILAEFGRIIAYAIASTETRRGLLTDRGTEVELELTDTDDVLHRLSTRLGSPVDFEAYVPQSGDHSLLYLSITEIPTAAVETAGTDISGIEGLRVVTEQDGTALFELAVSGPVLAATLVDCGALPTAIDTDGDRQRVVAMLSQTTDLRAFVDRLRAAYPSTTVVSRQDADRGVRTRETFRMELFDRLTQRQQETLRTAYFARYFDSPRGSTGTEIGQSLGISQPTFTYHLRGALETVLTMIFEEPPPLDA